MTERPGPDAWPLTPNPGVPLPTVEVRLALIVDLTGR